jgi:hypothetical protein
MAKDKKETFLLSEYLGVQLSQTDFNEFKRKYNEFLESNKLSLPEVKTIKMMLWAKREPITFGPYKDLSFFEISNRIYSDLVLLEATQKLFAEYQIKSIRLNMSNKGGNDMTIIDKEGNTVIGEAFNTACSFFQIKFRYELKKFKENQPGFIAFNKSALDDKKNETFYKNKLDKYSNLKAIICEI